MKVFDKIGLALFSWITLILAIILCLLIFGWLNFDYATNILRYAITDSAISTTILVISAIIILLDIKCIFFDSSAKEEARQKDGILLENNEGRLSISKDTLESLIATVAKGFNGAENVTSRVYVDKDNNLKVYVTLYVHPNAIIKDLSNNLQTKIKEAIKKTSDLDVQEVNIRVKNITPEKEITEEQL